MTVKVTQVPLPLRITGVPADFKAVMAMLNRPERSQGPSTSWSVSLDFPSGKGSLAVEVTPIPSTPPSIPPGAQQNPPTCTTDQGLQLCVTAYDADPMPAEVGGIQGLLGRISLFGLDESKWTTTVFG